MDKANRGDERTYDVIGAAMEVHAQLGPGFLESVYQEAMAVELALRRIPFQREVQIPVFYKGAPLDMSYRADFICFGSLLVEVKALAGLVGIDEAQVINYLKATRNETGLLVNFGAASLEWKRLVNTPPVF